MIRKLRRNLTAITMVLLTAVLIMILVGVYQGTRAGLRNESLDALQAADKELANIHQLPGTTRNPCFIITQLPDGTLLAVGSSLYDLSNQAELEQLLEQVKATQMRDGILKDRQLRFLRLEGFPGERYAFMDISAEQSALSRLNLICLVIFVGGVIGFFCISALLAHWAVRPVERAWEQQRQFVGDASHELKTPLTVIMTNAELLTDDSYDAENKARFTENILTMSRQMRGLVEELLNQARIDNSNAQRQRIDLSRLVEEAVLPFEPVYFEADRALHSHVQPKLFTMGSEDHLRRVVDILLDNGCKYSTPHSAVVLHLSRQGRNCLLSVSSVGTPLTDQQCKDIFKRFYRVDAARAMNRSYGLGLAIAQGIVEQHKGKIWVESRDGGNIFFVSLPIA